MKPTEAWAVVDADGQVYGRHVVDTEDDAKVVADFISGTVVPVLIVQREAVREATCIIDVDNVVCEICLDEVDARFAHPTDRVARVGIFELEAE